MLAMENVWTPPLPPKPRSRGMTMVLDKGMSLRNLEDWLEVAGPYTDVVKFGWGTSAVLPLEVVRAKVERLFKAQVKAMPGGTLTELYFLQDRITQLVSDFREAGFTMLEVSNGTVDMHPQQRSKLIRRLIREGFEVSTEVGNKDPARDRRLSWSDRARLVNGDLEVGASYVTIEARESGTLGFFGDDHAIQEDELARFLEHVDPGRVMFEAPIKSQQADLIRRLGPQVNLGNIAPEEVISLETLRRGLRSDTLMSVHGSPVSVRLGQGPADALAASGRGDVVVVVDALRASSTIVAALAAGATEVRVVASIGECVGDVTAGERGGIKLPTLDMDNSPTAMLRTDFCGRALSLTSTNGAECILAAASNIDARVLVGGMVNCTAVARSAAQMATDLGKGISVIMAGRNELLAPEDWLSATEIILAMGPTRLHPGVELMDPQDPVALFHDSEAGRNLVERGAESDVAFCAQRDSLDLAPVLVDGVFKRT